MCLQLLLMVLLTLVPSSPPAAAAAAAAAGRRTPVYPVMLQRSAQATVACAPLMALQQML
jgi:hypothetical protein